MLRGYLGLADARIFACATERHTLTALDFGIKVLDASLHLLDLASDLIEELHHLTRGGGCIGGVSVISFASLGLLSVLLTIGGLFLLSEPMLLSTTILTTIRDVIVIRGGMVPQLASSVITASSVS
jgi:hypothetical protein